MMMADNVFRESADGQVAHSSISLLFTDPNFSAAVHLHSEIFLPAAMKYVDQCEKRPTGADTSQTAYNLALGTKLPFFEYMQTSPDKARAFELAMKSVAEEDGNNIRYLVSGFDWAKLDEAMIVDVGPPFSSFAKIHAGLTDGCPGRRVYGILLHCSRQRVPQTPLHRPRPRSQCQQRCQRAGTAAAQRAPAHLLPKP